MLEEVVGGDGQVGLVIGGVEAVGRGRGVEAQTGWLVLVGRVGCGVELLLLLLLLLLGRGRWVGRVRAVEGEERVDGEFGGQVGLGHGRGEAVHGDGLVGGDGSAGWGVVARPPRAGPVDAHRGRMPAHRPGLCHCRRPGGLAADRHVGRGV